jgi:transcriptional regulator with XRE-family HTH domain
MVAVLGVVHHANMAKKRKGPGHFLREWRKARDLSLEQAAERVVILSQEWAAADPDARPITMTYATLSRIERGKIPYNQHLLELLADVYQTDAASLIMRDPSSSDAIWTLWESLEAPQRQQAVEILKAIRRTGTHG